VLACYRLQVQRRYQRQRHHGYRYMAAAAATVTAAAIAAAVAFSVRVPNRLYWRQSSGTRGVSAVGVPCEDHQQKQRKRRVQVVPSRHGNEKLTGQECGHNR